MSKTQLVIDALLGVTVLGGLIGAVGILFMRDLYERLHYVTPPATISVACLAAAVVVDKHLSSAGLKVLLIAVVTVLTNAVLTHATARAARVRQMGRWIADVTEVRGVQDASTAGLNSQPVVDSSDELKKADR